MQIHKLTPEIIPYILSLVEQSKDVFWIRTPDYSEQLYIGPAYETIWGRSCEDLYKNPEEWAKTLHPEDLQRLLASVEKRKPELKPGISFTETYRIIRPDGEIRWIKDKSVPIYDKAGTHIGFAGIAQDITAEKEAEILKLEAIAAEKRVDTIRLIGMSIAHELRTPLRAISSGVVGTANKLPTLLAVYKKAKEQGIEIPEGYPRLFPRDITILENVLKNIELETNAAFSVIDMLLIKGNLSKINKDKFAACHIVTCIKNALSRYPFQSGEKELVHCEGKDFVFHGDILLVVHVLFNLIKNALYFVKRAGKGSIQIWLEHGKDANILHFKDTGTGIPHDILPHIFDQFFSTESNGTGIGLAFCKFVMQSMDGDIECFSVEGEYTEFVLTFPHINI